MKSMTVYERKQEALKWLSLAILLQNKKPADITTISAEKSRLERVISDVYTRVKDDTEYNAYVLNFIKKHGWEMVYTDKYDYDIPVPEDPYILNIDTMIGKYTRKKAGAKF